MRNAFTNNVIVPELVRIMLSPDKSLNPGSNLHLTYNKPSKIATEPDRH